MEGMNFSSEGIKKKKRKEEEREVAEKEGSRDRVGKSRRRQQSTGKQSVRDEQKYCQTEARARMEPALFQALC